MKTQTTYSDKSLLTILLCFVNLIFNKLFSTGLLCLLFCNSFLPQQACSANCSAILSSSTDLLCITFFCHSVLLLLCLSFALFLIYISFHSVHQLELDPQHILLSPFLLFRSFFPTERPTYTVTHFLLYILHDGSTSHLLRQEQRQLSKQLNRHSETLTNSSS
jgi:hypothetical protein